MPSPERKLLVLDTSYSLEDIQKRGILASVTCRDLNGYFNHVWTIHPVATLVTSPAWTSPTGRPVWHEIAPAHTFIEGKKGRFKWLKWFPALNLLIAQTGLLFKLKRLVKKEKISVVRAGDILYPGLFGWALSRMCKVPLVVRVGGNHDKVYQTTGKPLQKRLFFSRKIEKKVERFVLKRADLVAGANQDNLNFALANGARKEYSTIFRYGNLLDKAHFIDPEDRKEGKSLLNEFGLADRSFALYIGRLEKVKLPDHVITTIADLQKNGYDLNALIVGGGTELDLLKKLAIDLGVADKIFFAGNRDQDWLSRVIPLAAMVLSPHTGRALSEAALGEVPVVAYDVDWQGELIENEKTGLLVNYNDQAAFSNAAERFLNDKEFAENMARALRIKAIDMLDPVKLDQHEIEAYEELFRRKEKQKRR